jgi:hypothetical protein
VESSAAVWNSCKISTLLKEMYKDYKCKLIHEGKLTEFFQVCSGVRHGCILSPILFLLYWMIYKPMAAVLGMNKTDFHVTSLQSTIYWKI